MFKIDHSMWLYYFLLHDFCTDGSSIRQFVKLLSATPTETLELITGAERCELEAQMRELGEDGASERCFVEAALEELKVCVSNLVWSD